MDNRLKHRKKQYTDLVKRIAKLKQKGTKTTSKEKHDISIDYRHLVTYPLKLNIDMNSFQISMDFKTE